MTPDSPGVACETRRFAVVLAAADVVGPTISTLARKRRRGHQGSKNLVLGPSRLIEACKFPRGPTTSV